MKRSIIIAVLGLATAAASYGQGLINFKNYFNSTQVTGVSYADGPNVGQYVGPEIKAELGYFIGTTADPSQLTPIPSSITPFGLGVATQPGALGTGAGWFDGGTQNIPGSAGTTITIGVLAFNGTDYATSSIRGLSQLFTGKLTSADSSSPTPDNPDWGNFTVASVPEPGTFALIGLGIGSMLFLRRRS